MPLGPEKKRQYDHEYHRLYYELNREKILEKRRNRTKEQKERALESQREWYRQNREAHIARVTERKWTDYSGTCVVCGAKTQGVSKAKPGSRFCKDHRKEQWEESLGKRVFTEATRDDPKSSRQSAVVIRQDRQARANRSSPSFSRLEHTEGRVRVWKNESQPPDTQEEEP